MTRPHIENLATSRMPWQRLALPDFPRGLRYRVLSVDPASGASSLSLKLAPGLRWPGGRSDSDLEIYVQNGMLAFGDERFGAGHYRFVPRGVVLPPVASAGGCELLAFYNDGPPSFAAADSDHPRAERDRLVVLDAGDLDWDGACPVPGQLAKRLHVDRATGAVTMLVALTPDFRRDAIAVCDAAVETFQLIGDSWSLQGGRVTSGGYAWRAPFASFGPWRSQRGALVLMRSDAELCEALHFDPWSGADQNRARAVRALEARRPALVAAARARR
jgi:hypothetical protein